MKNTGKKFLSDIKLHSDYLKWKDDLGRYETWAEACEDIIDGHRKKYAGVDIEEELTSALESMKEMKLLASQRNLQFRHESIKKHNMKLFNCCTIHVCRPRVFQEIFYMLLCGSGLGASLLRPFVYNLPKIKERTGDTKTFIIQDSIEGWSDAIGVLMSSYFENNHPFPEYANCKIRFDYSLIRPKGAYISGGFKAPGPDGLKVALEKIESLIDKWIVLRGNVIEPILAYDIICHISDSVLSGGLRRSALSMIVDPNDEEMIIAKTGNWRQENPQRARSNNSVLLLRNEVSKDQFEKLVALNGGDNDIGFVFGNNNCQIFNPCFTIDTKVLTIDGYKTFEELLELQSNNEEIFIIQDLRVEGFLNGVDELWKVDPYQTGNIVNKVVKVGKTGTSKQIVKITLDDGKSVRCTKNHIFFTCLGQAIKAENLLGQNILTENGSSVVVSIQDDGIEDVYCLEENVRRTLIANGIVAARCFEIGMTPINTQEELDDIPYSRLQDFCKNNLDIFGSQQCNLCEINAEKIKTKEEFLKVCKDATVLGTLQAGYTNFPYMTKATEDISNREALLGVSITGWMNNPKIFSKEWLNEGAEVCKVVNKEFSKKIGINQAARISTTKPSGNASVILGTSSGIHPEHSERYFRVMQLNKESEVAKYLSQHMSFLLEESVWSANKTDYVVFIPITNPPNALFKDSMKGVKHLELIKFAQEEWVNKGKNEELCISKSTSHNISNTVIIDNFEEITDYIWDNKEVFTAVSFISDFGDKDFNQAPFTSVLTPDEIFKEYGKGALFASGLIVDGLHYFEGNLWQACDCALDKTIPVVGTREQVLLKKSWLERAKKFAKNYFKGDMTKMVYCLKDVHLSHKWETINRQMKDVDFSKILPKPEYASVDKYAGIACSGGSCEVTRI